MPDYNVNPRIASPLPATTDSTQHVDLGRQSILYSYANTVANSYTGDAREYITKMGEYLATKAAYWDPVKSKVIPFDVKYGGPNEVFSDDKGDIGKSNQNPIDQRIVLPIISYYMTGMEYDNTRAQSPRNQMGVWESPVSPESHVLVAASPKPMKYLFQVDIWTATREQLLQLSQAIHTDFLPYGYLYDIYAYDPANPSLRNYKTQPRPWARMTLDSFSDSSNFIPGSDRRVVRAIATIAVEGWLSIAPIHTARVGTTDIEIL